MEKKDALFYDPAFRERLIPNPKVRANIEKMGWEPKDDLTLSILINRTKGVSLREKAEYLTRLARETEDQALRDLIEKALEERRKEFEQFQRPDGVYWLYDGDDAALGGYAAYDQAVEEGRRLGARFSILKYPLGSRRCDAIDRLNSLDVSLGIGLELKFNKVEALGGARYNDSGEVEASHGAFLIVPGWGLAWPWRASWLVREKWFTDTRVKVPNPRSWGW